jgi:outer membrane protein assembly factor BamD (BamD/ComL family)
MTRNKGLKCLISLAYSLIVVSSGCAAGPPASPQAQTAAKNPASNDDEDSGWLFRSLFGRKAASNETSQAPAKPSANPTVPDNQSPVLNYNNQPPAVQTTGLEAGPSTGGPAISKVTPIVSTEPIGEDNSGTFPVSILPPASPVTTAPPKMLPDPPPTPSSSADPMKDKDADFWSTLAPENVWKSIKKATGNGPNEAIARAAFKEGKELFQQKKYSEAAGKFATAADRWPDTPVEEDALFMLGESLFFSDQYPKAHDNYSSLLKKYSNSRHLDIAVAREFALARYWEQLDDYHHKWSLTPNITDNSQPHFDTFGYAVQAYQNVRMYDPSGPLADDSLMATATAYFRRGQFEMAALDFDVLRKEYPNSEHQKAAHILGLQAKMRVYQGKYYDPTALQEAGEITDQTLTQFGSQLGGERTRLLKAKKQILEEKADREYAMAQYYEKQKYFGSARLYYQGLIEMYPSTDRAKDARTRLDAIKGEPDVPPNYLKWLTDILPASKK